MVSSIDTALPVEPLRVARLEPGRPETTRTGGTDAEQSTRALVPPVAPADSESVSEAVTKVRDFVQVVRRDLEFSVDEETGRTVITVLDSASGEVVRQIPPEEILAVAENLAEVQGILFQGTA
jgi:flagellar protein FlaG